MKSIFYGLIGLMAIGLFFFYTNPAYQDSIKQKRAQIEQYDQVIEESKTLIGKRDSLIKQRNAIDPSELDRLIKLLPDTVDTVRLVFDIDRVASQYGLVVRKVRVGEPGKDETASKTVAFRPDTKDYGVISLNFSVTATYEAFVRFIRDLEDSLRIADITEISFKTGENQLSDYSVTLKTYWLK
ncbi:MAG: type 4a pilus biogenesis protein PilO [Patescibacteria group bacterium]